MKVLTTTEVIQTNVLGGGGGEFLPPPIQNRIKGGLHYLTSEAKGRFLVNKYQYLNEANNIINILISA